MSFPPASNIPAGISLATIGRIPPQWDAQWFANFVAQFLQPADIRNAQSADGSITISGTTAGSVIGSVGNIQVGSTIKDLFSEPYVLAVAPPDAALTQYRLLTPQSGVLTTTDGGATGAITVGVAANGIGNAQIRQGAALSVIGNATNATANVADIVGTSANTVLQSTGTGLTFAAVPLTALATQANDTVVGNISGGAAAPAALTQTQLTALINTFTASLSGAVPSGATAGQFLGAGGWATPAYPSSASPSASIGLAAVDGTAATFMTSDSAPALSQAIAPTWTGAHTFEASPIIKGTSVLLNFYNSTPAVVGQIGTVEGWIGSGTDSTDFAVGAIKALNLYVNGSTTAALGIATTGTVTIPGGLAVEDGLTVSGAVGAFSDGFTVSAGTAEFEGPVECTDFSSTTGTEVVLTSGNLLAKSSSSARYKADIQTLQDAEADEALRLRPVTYRDKVSGLRLYGFIAEEVEQVLPDLVYHNQDGSAESVHYRHLTALLLNQIKRLTTDVVALKAANAARAP